MKPSFDADHLRRFFSYMLHAGSCVEIRIPNAEFREGGFVGPGVRFAHTISGWYDQISFLVFDTRRLKEITGYVTVNPVDTSLLSRANNSLKGRTKTTKDTDITAIRWSFIDIDSIRATNTSATEEELSAALAIRDKILSDHPEMMASSIWGTSGNGGFILTRLADLPNSPQVADAIVRQHHVLADFYDTPQVKIDPTTTNPSRIMCIPGTVKCKGVSTPERPWRLSTIDGAGADPAAIQPFNLTAWLSTQADPLPRTGKGPVKGKKRGGSGSPSEGFALAADAPFDPTPTETDPALRDVVPPMDAKQSAERKFALKALEDESAAVASAPSGRWNFTLNKSAGSLFSLVAVGALTAEEVESALTAASAQRGHSDSEVAITIASGRDYGMDHPRDLSGVGTKAGVPAAPLWETGNIGYVPLPPVPTEPAEEFDATDRPTFETDDVGNAERFKYLHGHRVRYCSSYKEWMIYDGRRWKIDDCCEVEALAKTVPDQILKEIPQGDYEENKKEIARLLKWRSETRSAPRLAAILKTARSQPGIPVTPGQFDRAPWLLNCLNGTLDLRDGKLFNHSSDDLITKLAPVIYDPKATCPRWERFLAEVMDFDMDLVDYLARAAGYAATGVIKQHAFFVCHGQGMNGKTTFLKKLVKLLGDYATEMDPELLMDQNSPQHPTRLTELEGRRFVVSEESEEHGRLAEGVVKRLTGGNIIQARRLYADFYTFDPSHHLFLATNHKPEIHGTDAAIWRRMKAIPFVVSFDPKIEGSRPKDDKLEEVLDSENSGILNWLVRGCKAWQERGLDAPKAVELANEEYRAEQDILGGFLRDRTVPAKGMRIPANVLYAEYRTWCDANGNRPLSARKFALKLKDKGIRTIESHGASYRVDLRFRVQDDYRPMDQPPESFDFQDE